MLVLVESSKLTKLTSKHSKPKELFLGLFRSRVWRPPQRPLLLRREDRLLVAGAGMERGGRTPVDERIADSR